MHIFSLGGGVRSNDEVVQDATDVSQVDDLSRLLVAGRWQPIVHLPANARHQAIFRNVEEVRRNAFCRALPEQCNPEFCLWTDVKKSGASRLRYGGLSFRGSDPAEAASRLLREQLRRQRR